MQKNKTLRYISGVCFGIYALLELISIISMIPYSEFLSVWSFLLFIGPLVLSISMFVPVKKLRLIGCVIFLIPNFAYLILNFMDGSVRTIIIAFLDLIVIVMLLLIILNKKNAKTFGIIAALAGALCFIIHFFIDSRSILTFRHILYYVVLSSGALFFGLSESETADSIQATVTVEEASETN